MFQESLSSPSSWSTVTRFIARVFVNLLLYCLNWHLTWARPIQSLMFYRQEGKQTSCAERRTQHSCHYIKEDEFSIRRWFAGFVMTFQLLDGLHLCSGRRNNFTKCVNYLNVHNGVFHWALCQQGNIHKYQNILCSYFIVDNNVYLILSQQMD